MQVKPLLADHEQCQLDNEDAARQSLRSQYGQIFWAHLEIASKGSHFLVFSPCWLNYSSEQVLHSLQSRREWFAEARDRAAARPRSIYVCPEESLLVGMCFPFYILWCLPSRLLQRLCFVATAEQYWLSHMVAENLAKGFPFMFLSIENCHSVVISILGVQTGSQVFKIMWI